MCCFVRNLEYHTCMFSKHIQTNYLDRKVSTTVYMAIFAAVTVKAYILGKIMKGSPNGLFHIWYIKSDPWRKSGKILKNGFRFLGRGSKMKHFPLKFWHLKNSFSLFSKVTIFAKFSKNHVLSFLLMSGLCDINSIQ